MAEEIKQQVKEVKAHVREIHMSPRKVRLVADLVKKLPVNEALEQLQFLTKRAAAPVRKLINSAVANASHNFQIEADRLFVKSITVDGGRVFFRYKPRAQGRAMPVRKRTSHINLVLGVNAEKVKPKRKVIMTRSIKEEPQRAATPVEQPAAAEQQEQKPRWGLFRRKDHQVMPKPDVKGKKYTSFDRRGGE